MLAGWMKIMDAWMPDNWEFPVIIMFYTAVRSCIGQHRKKLYYDIQYTFKFQ
jgi:hypothetical protein